MSILEIWKTLIQETVNSVLYWLNLPITFVSQLAVIVVYFLAAYFFINMLVWFIEGVVRLFRPKPNEEESVKMIEKDDDALWKKIADLYCYAIKDPRPGSLKIERTGRGIRGVCEAKKRESLQQSEEIVLTVGFNGDWFFLRNPRLLVSYQLDLFDHQLDLFDRVLKDDGDESGSTSTKPDMFDGELEEGATRPDFVWESQPMKIHAKFRSQYEVEVEGYYPHLTQDEKRISLLLTEFEGDEISEDIEDRFLLFEEISLQGGVFWQGRRIFVWEGFRLTKEEIAAVGEQLLDKKSEKMRFDIEEMID